MPEGDTIHRLAARLAPRLTGARLERVTTQGLERAIAGRTVASVGAHGKHLAIDLDDGTTVRIHLGVSGRCRIFGRTEGEAALARISPGRASLALVTATDAIVWLGARTVEISARRAPHHGEALAALGPDVLSPTFDPHAAAARARPHAARAIGELLLDQRIAAGIGNIYKSEVLFLRGIDPRTPVGALDDATLADLYATAHEVMSANLGPGPRRTRSALSGDASGDARFHVYSRTGQPCRACRTSIECYALGAPPRWTWSCPVCQRSPPPGETDR
ncbi:MAG: DNA-formamidopyrimidine glycosylase family protein [Kofleriaceae bacterium]